MYKITAPNEKYDRKIGGLRFVDGVAETDSEWLASWFSGRVGFSVETVESENDKKAEAEAAAKKAAAEKKKAEAAAKKAAKEAEKQKESADDGDSGKSKEAAT